MYLNRFDLVYYMFGPQYWLVDNRYVLRFIVERYLCADAYALELVARARAQRNRSRNALCTIEVFIPQSTIQQKSKANVFVYARLIGDRIAKLSIRHRLICKYMVLCDDVLFRSDLQEEYGLSVFVPSLFLSGI